MWFHNIQLYRLPENWDMTADQLSEQLARIAFQPCGSQDLSSQGWAPVIQDSLVHGLERQWLIALGVEQRLLPASVIRQETEERASQIEISQGFRPGRKQLREIKEAVMQELLPRAFTRRKRIYAWIDPEKGFLAIDVPGRNAAEPVVETLHKALDELPLKLLNTERSPGSAMTDWLSGGEAPAPFTIDQDCELRAMTDESSAIRYVRHSLEGEELKGHIAAGKQVTRLALTFDDRISFVLTDKFEIKRLQPLDTLLETSGGEANSREEQFDADFALMTGELRRLIPALIEALGGEARTV